METVMVGVLIPLLGTALGAACVLFLHGEMGRGVRSILSGFAGGIMVAASVWSLLIPAIERSQFMGRLSFLPAASGLVCGVALLILLDEMVSKLYAIGAERKSRSKMLFAVTLHNLPEGMAVGAIFAGALAGDASITMTAGMVLAIGVAVQNVPEGAIVSMPLCSDGMGRGRALLAGVLSGVVEPLGAVITVLAASVVVPLLPFLLGLAAGTMLYVAAEELIPEVARSGHARAGNIAFALGFTLMMALDVALG